MDLVNQKYEELINTKDKDGNPLDEAIINQKIKNFAILQRKENFETAEKRFTEMAKKYPTEDDLKKGDAKSLVNDYISQLDDENSKYVDADITAAMEAGDMDKYKAALHKFGKARLGEYDKNNDGTISKKEFKSRERGTGDTKIKRNDLNKRFDYLDVNGDGKLDEKEMTAYYYAMTKCTDGENEKTGNDITYREYMTAQQALASAGSKSITANEKLIYDKFTSWRKEGYDNL
jgi:Ca2+-binding EF-hand superfamily protein